MKKLILFIAALLPFCGVSAQEQTQTETGISFLEGTYAEALKPPKMPDASCLSTAIPNGAVLANKWQKPLSKTPKSPSFSMNRS